MQPATECGAHAACTVRALWDGGRTAVAATAPPPVDTRSVIRTPARNHGGWVARPGRARTARSSPPTRGSAHCGRTPKGCLRRAPGPGNNVNPTRTTLSQEPDRAGRDGTGRDGTCRGRCTGPFYSLARVRARCRLFQLDATDFATVERPSHACHISATATRTRARAHGRKAAQCSSVESVERGKCTAAVASDYPSRG